MMGNIDPASIPQVTPPWLENQQQGQQQGQQPQQNTATAEPSFDSLGVATKLFEFGAQKYFTGAAGTEAVKGAVSAGGGTYVTGPGLAGQAGAIHTSAPSAGGGLSAGLKGGLASAGAGLIGGYIGGRLFGSNESAVGASTGASIGLSVGGPIGAIAGTIFGGIGGKLFESGDEPVIQFSQGANLSKGEHLRMVHKQNISTDLGNFAFGEDELKPHQWEPILDSIKQSDSAVAGLLDSDQLARAKRGLTWFDSGTMAVKPKGDRAQGLVKKFMKQRYGMAMGGLDLDYRDTFDRVVTDENMGGLVTTMAGIDRDIQQGRGDFADFQPDPFTPSDISGEDIRLQEQISIKNPDAGKVSYKPGLFGVRQRVVEPDYIMADNPDYDAALADRVNSFKVLSGYNYTGHETTTGVLGHTGPTRATFDEQSDFGRRTGAAALDHLSEKYGLGARPGKPEQIKPTQKQQRILDIADSKPGGVTKGVSPYYRGMEAQARNIRRDISQRQEGIDKAYNRKLGAWEKKVLDEYASRNTPGSASTGISVSRGSGISADSGSAQYQGLVINRNRGLLSQSGVM